MMPAAATSRLALLNMPSPPPPGANPTQAMLLPPPPRATGTKHNGLQSPAQRHQAHLTPIFAPDVRPRRRLNGALRRGTPARRRCTGALPESLLGDGRGNEACSADCSPLLQMMSPVTCADSSGRGSFYPCD